MRRHGIAGIAALTVAADHNPDFARFAWRLGRQITAIVLARVCLVTGLVARLHQFSANDLSSQITDAGFRVGGRRAADAQRCQNKRSQSDPEHHVLLRGR
jgi:hypothetical protein